MKNSAINNKGQAQIFKNPYLESLTKTRPWVIYARYIPAVTACLLFAYFKYNYPVFIIISIFLLAIAGWSLFEYLVHRFLFHFEAKGAWARRLVYIFHENHHEFPRDRSRLFMPPVPSILMSGTMLLMFCSFSVLLSGTIGYGLLFFAGFIAGYLTYVSLHYAIHAYAPPKYFKALWRNHYLHHYKYPDKAFGVSSMLWDKLFGTMPGHKLD